MCLPALQDWARRPTREPGQRWWALLSPWQWRCHRPGLVTAAVFTTIYCGGRSASVALASLTSEFNVQVTRPAPLVVTVPRDGKLLT